MERLRSKDARLLLDAAWELHAHRDLRTLPELLLHLVPRLVRSEITGYNELNPGAGRFVALANPAELDMMKLGPRMLPYVGEHPLIRHAEETGDSTPLRISDFLPRQRFRETGLYREFYRDLGVEYQLALPIVLRLPLIVAMSASRRNSDFTARDQTMFRLLQPHVQEAYSRLELRHQLNTQVHDQSRVLSGLRTAYLVLDHRQRIVRAQDHAREWLQQYFGTSAPESALPLRLGQFVRAELDRTRASSDGPPAFHRSWIVESLDCELRIEVLTEPHEGETRVVLSERPRGESTAALRNLGLSAREAEVLLWLCRGKSNPEIGRILGISRRTVHKHLERVFHRLGVENRTAAVAFVKDQLNTPAG